MFLNIFFDRVNSSLELVLIGVFIFAIYWFVLRRYNSLGLRMLFLCIFLFTGCCTWLYKDEIALKSIITKGEEYTATIVSASITGTQKDNEVTVTFITKDGHVINSSTSKYVSQDEWQNFQSAKPLTIIYLAATGETFVKESLMRFKKDKIMLYFFAGFWLVLGAVLYFWLRKYKVGVDDKGNEWLEKKDGTIFFDERRSGAYRMAEKGTYFLNWYKVLESKTILIL